MVEDGNPGDWVASGGTMPGAAYRGGTLGVGVGWLGEAVGCESVKGRGRGGGRNTVGVD